MFRYVIRLHAPVAPNPITPTHPRPATTGLQAELHKVLTGILVKISQKIPTASILQRCHVANSIEEG